ncbi:hydrogenase assembly protein HypC [Candidatus Altiarchaeales archaeon WOR_SM1_SCG]|nr:hydrogenase assembly protein HypC [Candidatus Altiarchaeales archaeon WOR_SM1_SCG]
MCLGIPGIIKKINGDAADVDFGGVIKKINISLIDNPAEGKYILAHAGFAIETMEKADAEETISLLLQLQ